MESIYEQIQLLNNQHRTSLSNDCGILYLNLSHIAIVEFQRHLIFEFNNIIYLDLSNCVLNKIENGAFDTLLNLKSINLSNNLIGNTDNDLFKMNSNLIAIILKNNFLESINKTTFSTLFYLEILDLSNNFITILKWYCLDCQNLKKLDLNNNEITYVDSAAFHQLPNLVQLNLNDNRIKYLNNEVFLISTQLEYLNLNNNNIELINNFILRELRVLQVFTIKNNYITHVIYNAIFVDNTNLVEIDLSDNEINGIEMLAFSFLPNLKVLNLTIQMKFRMQVITNLLSLAEFRLTYNSLLSSTLLKRSFYKHFCNVAQVTVIKLLLQNIATSIPNFSQFKNLEYLHIECLQPNNQSINIDFMKLFNDMPKLKTLILKKVNFFTLFGYYLRYSFSTKNLNYIDFTGIQNSRMNNFLFNFQYLEYLNLSFSAIETFSNISLQNSINLKQINLEHSKLKCITSQMFLNATKLEIINCANCRIEVIEDFAFITLDRLLILDLRNNLLTYTNEYTFFGLCDNTSILLDSSVNI